MGKGVRGIVRGNTLVVRGHRWFCLRKYHFDCPPPCVLRFPLKDGSKTVFLSGSGIEKLLYLSLSNIQLKVVTRQTAAEEIREESKASGPAEQIRVN